MASAFEGSNGFRFTRQFVEYGLKDKLPIVGGMTHLDEAVLRNMGDEALGTITSCWYSAELDNPINKAFAPAFRKKYSYDPGFYAAATYTNGAVLEAALTTVDGKVDDKNAFMKALRNVKVTLAAARSRSMAMAMSSATCTSGRWPARKAVSSIRSSRLIRT